MFTAVNKTLAIIWLNSGKKLHQEFIMHITQVTFILLSVSISQHQTGSAAATTPKLDRRVHSQVRSHQLASSNLYQHQQLFNQTKVLKKQKRVFRAQKLLSQFIRLCYYYIFVRYLVKTPKISNLARVAW